MGREGLVALLEDARRRAAAGRGGVVALSGEPGIGKSSLAEHLADAARSVGTCVAWGFCRDGAGAPPLWPLVEVGRTVPAVGARLDADGVVDLPADERGRFLLLDAVGEALVEAAPLVVVIEDLHWADPLTLALVEAVAPRLVGTAVLLVVTYRDTEVPAELAGMLARSAVTLEHLPVGGLASDAVAELLGRVTGAPLARADAEAVHRRTGGNPFSVTQIGRLLAAEGGRVDVRTALPPSVRAVVGRRLARLPDTTQRVLEAAAVAGDRVDTHLLAAVTGLDLEDLHMAVDAAVEARLVRLGGGVVRFVHALVRDALVAAAGDARVRSLHRAVGEALLADRGEDPAVASTIAVHLFASGGSVAAGPGVDAALRAAAHATRMLAFEAAADLLEQARVHAGGRPGDQRAVILLELGEARRRAGDWEAATSACREAAGLARQLGDARILARAALGMGADLGGFEVRLMDRGQLAILEEALGGLHDEPLLRSLVLARRSVAASGLAAPEERAGWSREAVEAARSAGDAAALVAALASWCDAVAGPAHSDLRLRTADEMLGVARAAGDRFSALLARRFRLVALLERGDPAAGAEIDRYCALADDLGVPLYRWYVPLLRGMQALDRGDPAEAERLAEAAAAIGAQAASHNAVALSNTLKMAVAFETGRAGEVRALITDALVDHPEFRELAIYRVAMAYVTAMTGELDTARVLLDRLLAGDLAAVADDAERLSTLAGVAHAAVVVRHEPAAAWLLDALAPHRGGVVVDGIGAALLGPVDLLVARLQTVLGVDPRPAFQAAREVAERSGSLLHRLRAEEAHGRWLAQHGDSAERARGTDVHSAASARLAACGLAPWPEPGGNGSSEGAAGRWAPAVVGRFVREGAVWAIAFDGVEVRLPDAKGLRDLAVLIAAQGREVSAVALVTAATPDAPAPTDRGAAILDAAAKAAYRARLVDLDTDLAEAEADADVERASLLRWERDAVIEQLTTAAGLGGRARRVGDDVERARKAVTMRVRASIDRIGRVHPPLARHLERAVRTGTWCAYDPEHPVVWRT